MKSFEYDDEAEDDIGQDIAEENANMT